MKAVVLCDYGPPDVLQCRELPQPTPAPTEVLVKIHAAGLNPLDLASLQAPSALLRLLFGLPKPTTSQPCRFGVDLAGEVEAVGTNVTRFVPGDDVFGICIDNPKATGAKAWLHRQGSLAEYVCVPEGALARKPANTTYDQAASLPVAALTALQGLRDTGDIQPESKVLINGAAGGVGTLAVQIAKAFGAEVTAVCSTANVDLAKSIGADHLIDYTQQNFSKLRYRYDLIFDCVGNHSLSDLRHLLAPKGCCVMVGDLTGRPLGLMMARIARALVLSFFGGRKFRTFLAKPNQDDLDLIGDFLAGGSIKAVVDKCYSLAEVSDAVRYLARKHAKGKVVISVVSATAAVANTAGA